MHSVFIAVFAGLAVGLGLGLPGALGPGWSVFFGVLAFIAVNVAIGVRMKKRMGVVMADVQGAMAEGQKQMQAKLAMWRIRPPSSVQAAEAELARDRKAAVKAALEKTAALEPFRRWIPMMGRQIATMQFQLYWMIPDFAKVDELMPRAIFMDPAMAAMKIARMYMRDEPGAAIKKVYDKAAARLRYNQNVLLAATYSWILVKRNEIDEAHRVLVRALEKSDNQFLKANRDVLANNRVAHFNNSGLGEQWYALQLEEPKRHAPRQRMQWK